MSDLVVQECEFWFVWTKTGHIPRHTHNAQASAEAEADRLAMLKPHGKKYIVLKAVRKCHVPQDDELCGSRKCHISPSAPEAGTHAAVPASAHLMAEQLANAGEGT